MSSEYTIDIQLTELGFRDILQPLDTPIAASLDNQYAPTLLSRTSDESQTVNEGRPVDGGIHQTCARSSPIQISCKPLHLVQTEDQHESVYSSDEGTLHPTHASPAHSSGKEKSEIPPLTAKQTAETGQKSVHKPQEVVGNLTELQLELGDSELTDDSEVSEIDEDDEEEEEDSEDDINVECEFHHSGDHRCGVCDLLLPSNVKLHEHMNLHTGVRPYCCAECGKRFYQIHSYRSHLRSHARAKVDPFSCRVCLMHFESQETLRIHLTNNHLENKFYECDLCKRIFADLKLCQQHVDWHNRILGKFSCEKCRRLFKNEATYKRHKLKMCRFKYRCTDCKVRFFKKNALLKHSFSHIGLLPYTCVRCQSHFRLAKLYRQHKCVPERIHCVACLRVFLSQEDFQKHKKDTGCWGHQEPKRDEIRCLECGQKFPSSEELKKHAGAHQRVLTCAECGKGFRSALLLMSHMGGHAGQTPCMCQTCGLGFPHQQDYDSHLKNCGKTPLPTKRLATKRQHSPVKPKPVAKHKDLLVPVKTNVPANPQRPKKAPSTQLNSRIHTVSIHPKDIKVPDSLVKKPSQLGAPVPPGPPVWRLSLDKQPPPGVKLVVFVPADSALASGLTAAHPALGVEATPHLALLPTESTAPASGMPRVTSCFSLRSAAGVLQHQGLFGSNTQAPGDDSCAAPLDLSQKSTQPEVDLRNGQESGVAGSVTGKTFQAVAIVNGKEHGVKCLNDVAERDTSVKKIKLEEPLDLSPHDVNTSSAGLIMNIKTEPTCS